MEHEKRYLRYKEDYFYELNRRDKLTSELSIPISIITLLLGAIGYLYSKHAIVLGILPIIFYFSAFLVLLSSFIFSVYYIIRSYYNYQYEYVPKSHEIEQYYKELVEYFTEDIEKIDEALSQYFIRVYCQCNKRNTLNNDTKSSYLHKARTSIVIALIAGFISLISAYSNNIYEDFKTSYNNLSLTRDIQVNKEKIRNDQKENSNTTVTTTRTTTY